MRHLITLLSTTFCALLLISTFAHSANTPGFYLGLEGGGSQLDDSSSSDLTGSYTTGYDKGSFAALTVGYNLGEYDAKERGGRVEIEVSSRSNDLETVSFSNSQLAAEGTLSVTSIMITSIGESHTNPDCSPYVGIGIGAAQVKLEDASISGNLMTDDKDVILAGQIKAGLAFSTTDWLTIDVGYRFFKTADLEFIDVQGRDVKSEYSSHNIALGLRFNF